MWTIFDAFVFATGFAACWLLKDNLARLVFGAERLARSLESKLAALKAKL